MFKSMAHFESSTTRFVLSSIVFAYGPPIVQAPLVEEIDPSFIELLLHLC